MTMDTDPYIIKEQIKPSTSPVRKSHEHKEVHVFKRKAYRWSNW